MKKQHIEFDEKGKRVKKRTKTEIFTVLSQKSKEINELKQNLEKVKQAHMKETQRNEAQREEINY